MKPSAHIAQVKRSIEESRRLRREIRERSGTLILLASKIAQQVAEAIVMDRNADWRMSTPVEVPLPRKIRTARRRAGK